MKTIDRELPMKLSGEARASRGEELAKAQQHLEGIKAEKTRACANFNVDIKETSKRISVLAKAVATGEETAMVQCEERTIFATNTIEVVRLDTSEIVETRAMTAKERQLDHEALGGDGAPAVETEGKKKKKVKGGGAKVDAGEIMPGEAKGEGTLQ